MSETNDFAEQHRRDAELLEALSKGIIRGLDDDAELTRRWHAIQRGEGVLLAQGSSPGKLIRRSAGTLSSTHGTTMAAFKLITRSASRLDKAAGPGDQVVISGLPIPYDVLSMDLGGYRELYQRGCFAGSLGNDLAVLFNHDPAMVLGRTSAGTAVFYEEQDGVHCDAVPPDVTWARDLITSMMRGDIRQMSACFRITKAHGETRNGLKVCVIEKGDLMESSVVSMAAYGAATNVSVVDESAIDSQFLKGIGITA